MKEVFFHKLAAHQLERGYERLIVLTLLLASLIIPSPSHAEVLVGKVTSIHGDVIELNLGSEKGVHSGDSGRVYYTIKIGEKEKPIFIAKFKVTHLSEKSSMAHIEDSTAEVKAGYSVEVVVKERAWLEVKSEPSGAKVYIDGKESGQTPLSLSDIRAGRHQIRVVKEGYESYEVSAETGVGRKEIFARLRQVLLKSELLIRTDPTRATIYLNEKPVGTSPFEGKGLSPGKYQVRVTQEGYETWKKEITLKPGEILELPVQLALVEGELVVTAQPSLAKIYINGKFVGNTQYTGKDLRPGRYSVRVAKEGYEIWEKDVRVEPGKKIEVVARLEEIDWTKKSCGAPVWNIGDKWIYKKANGGIFAHEVVKIEEDLFVVKVEGLRQLMGYDKKTMNNNFLLEPSGHRTQNKAPSRKLYDFPIVVGKKWSDTTTTLSSVSKKEATFSSEFQIEGIEEITTPAGTFKAFKIYYRQTVISPQRGSGWVRIWYSPVIKNWIKREVEKSLFWQKATLLKDAELISYELK
jgi:hypothetical protein